MRDMAIENDALIQFVSNPKIIFNNCHLIAFTYIICIFMQSLHATHSITIVCAFFLNENKNNQN